ncbi:uncharacterized protein BCR38DRAFT_433905 [Pseudomassariella vexata]|uniref:ABC transporter domain-containing protein n=1 Tax=Pseudomassariella vexata TaxID=1141098 RepID=A0A1Y2DXN8_9PEZI|nr:uncharacterized protein BCR38DRAFT_433905 [Pseudomassariella vexata]ORY64062.1 hypothetical protein BCR38DRAFT_433905 [Pseudomassariella vexata]
MDCTPNANQSFGPRMEPGCRSFDLPSLFENLVFACLPAALFIALSPWSFVKLLRRPALFSLRIDNVDTSALRRSDLRHITNVVPQDPLWIPGTIRANVDPFHVAPDEAIFAAIVRVGLGSLLEAHGTDKVIDVAVLSTGQKQLLCFARAMIKTSKILVLDEAMSR